MEKILTTMDSIVWGPPLLILLLGTGVYLTFKLKFLQVTKLSKALSFIFKKEEGAKGDVSSFGALCTALSATIGTGNIVGVATAIKAGGPGALFWMWIAAFFGMATKYAEGVLAIKYREFDENGVVKGGPMYYIQNGMGNKFLAKIFALCGVLVALFGIGTFAQVNSISEGLKTAFNVPIIITAIVITILVAMVTLGGIQRISKVSEMIVPFMALLYIIGVVMVIVFNINKVPEAVRLIVQSAFNPKAAFGGATGISIIMVIQRGVSRGVFSNEAGLGSAPIAAAAAKTNSPARQGLISMTGTFFDTIVICTMTGIVIVLTGMYNSPLEGTALTTAAFEAGLPIALIGKYIVNIGLVFFAFTTILGWNYYGEKCVEYLIGKNAIIPFKILYIVLVGIGAFISLDVIFIGADIVNGLMAIPNLIAIIALRKIIFEETDKLFYKESKEEIKELICEID
ncbi:alanine/glycine:cation symporter family protein [Eubacterium multiforme]|uniref:AGCS family alanine or glycine:cation symporter n=1 Tax=Eubacterium multiforme TaxID=83339 RepID=A0ABT9UUU4_9FIRM|nr:sodium:alanine symporter family protein [Eubacterium multiforme]MDQ0150090.1 AGCS family alanine or glycine:cation symporter [Eubacterium multiforme]